MAPGSVEWVSYGTAPAAMCVPAFDWSEDLFYVVGHILSVDALCYINYMIHQSWIRIFGPILNSAESQLFCGEHVRGRGGTPSVPGGLANFVMRSSRCLGCKAAHVTGDTRAHCKRDMAMVALLGDAAVRRDMD